MTFLEYVCRRMLGRPARDSATPGECYWCCPFHVDSSPSFHTLPHRQGKKDYWKCFGCGLWGDEYNLLRSLRDIVGRREANGGLAEHTALLEKWRMDYEEVEKGAAVVEPNVTGGKGSQADRCPGCGCLFSSVDPLSIAPPRDIGLSAAEVWATLDSEQRKLLAAAYRVACRALEGVQDVSMEDLASYCWEENECMEGTQRAHMQVCKDPECSWLCCRLARGMTQEEVDRTIEAAQRAARERQRRERAERGRTDLPGQEGPAHTLLRTGKPA
jgi:hypothetical protein